MFAFGFMAVLLLALVPLTIIAAIIGHVVTAGQREWRFELTRVISNTFTAVGRAPLFFVGTAVVLGGLPSAAFQLLGMGTAVAALAGVGGGATAPVLIIGYVVVVLFTSTLMQIALARGAVDALENREVDAGAALSTGFRLMLPGIALAIASTLGMLLGFLFFVFPALILMCMWAVLWPVLAIEQGGVGNAFVRSAELTSGARWSILLLLIISAVIYFIISAMLGAIVGVSALMLGDGSRIALVVSPLITSVLGVFPPAGLAAIYFELKSEKEGLASGDLEAVFA